MASKRKKNAVPQVASEAPAKISGSDLPIEVIDPKGDVILVVGGEGRLRVSSNVLASACDVFKAMFNGPFIESQNLNPEDPREISLEDDDYKGALLMCLLLHHRFERKGALPLNSGNIGGILAMAVFADKYQCKESVGHLATLAINFEKMDLGTSQLLYLTVAGYLLRSQAIFGKCSQRIIYGHGGRKLRHMRKQSKIRALFPEDLCGTYQCHVVRAARRLTSNVEILEEERATFQKVLLFNFRFELKEKRNSSTDHLLWPNVDAVTRNKTHRPFLSVAKENCMTSLISSMCLSRFQPKGCLKPRQVTSRRCSLIVLHQRLFSAMRC